ncbi:hypothetical protein BG011_009260 [Mortierella polycephala]|uniref:5'-nucleotidase n=1 Tax=Mortierella polycephala TaxID=41804 RepID=A0A9P6TWC2_9FUNG|nr:hypothetical protein BG011_009260 [Mortierella polycephala]
MRSFVPLILAATTAIFSATSAQGNNGWFNLTVLHTNDVHARVDPANNLGASCTADDIAKGECYGGAARHKTLIQKLRNGKQHSLLLDGGDEFQGTLFYTYYKGNVTAEVMNELGYDLTTIGNHEWDDGPENVARFWPQLKMPVVCANIDFSKNPGLSKWVKPYHIFEDLGVAIIGYITPTTGDISNSGPTISFTDPIPAVQKYIDELQAKGIKKILALSHNGYEEDMVLAAKTRGLDLIVGGHSHSYLGDPKNPLYQGPYPTVVKDLGGDNTLIVQAYCWGRYIGNLDVSFNPEGKIVSWAGAPVLVENTITADKALSEKIDGWRHEFEDWGRTVLGEATDTFDLVGCRNRDCAMGNFITDAMLDHVRHIVPKPGKSNKDGGKHPWADLAITNSGSIRSGISKGNVTVEMVLTTSPFGNAIVQTPMKGKEILKALEAVVVGQYKDSGNKVTSFTQVSGLRFKFDSSRSLEKNHLVKVEIHRADKKWVKVDPRKTYSVVTNDFLLNGGDNIFVKMERAGTIQHEKLDKALMDHLERVKRITPYVDDRIHDVAVKQPTVEKRSDFESSDERLEWMPLHMRS